MCCFIPDTTRANLSPRGNTPTRGAAFQAVKSFGEYRFFLPERIERGNVYLVGKEDKIYAGEDLSAYSVTYFENYYVIDAT